MNERRATGLPIARVARLTDTIGGIEFEDPYRWLEESSSETLSWQENQNAFSDRFLRGWPGYETLRAEIAGWIQGTNVVPPLRGGNRWFELIVDPELNRPRLMFSEEFGGEQQLLVDPIELAHANVASIDWYYPSPNGGYVAFGLSTGGTEQSVLHIVDVTSRELLRERIAFTSLAKIAWLPDSSGFYFNGGLALDEEHAEKRIFFHRLGEEPPSAPEPLEFGDTLVYPQVSADGRYVSIVVGFAPACIMYTKDRASSTPWRRFAPDLDSWCIGEFVDDAYVAVTTDGAPRGRLVAIPVATSEDRETWRELVAESDAVMHGVVRTGKQLVLCELVDTFTRLRIVSLDGKVEHVVPLPDRGTVGQTLFGFAHPWFPMVTDTSPDFTLLFQSFTAAPSLYQYDSKSRTLDPLTTPARELSGATVRQLFCESTAGVRIPVSLVYRNDLDLSRPHPTLIYAYGGFMYSVVASYLGAFGPFIEAGGVYVSVNLRGGGEYGLDWWETGRRQQKQNVFDDLYSAAEFLIANGVTEPGQLALLGASNGGLLTAVAVTQRPDLFRAVVSLVPVTDMLRYTLWPYLKLAISEFGDPEDPADAHVLHSYSPYHNIRDNVDYPAALVVCGASDSHVPAWHARKMVARLQAASASEEPILLRVWEETGHIAGSPTSADASQTAEWVGFVMNRLGIEP